MKMINPPAPPDIMPQSIPINGSERNIVHQEIFSTSRIIFPISLPEKKPTIAEIKFTTASTPNIHISSERNDPFSEKNLMKIAAGGKVPKSKPKYEKAFSLVRGFFINFDSNFSRSVE